MTTVRILGKFGKILSRHQKVCIVKLAVLMLFGGILEMLSVSLILPFTEAILNPNDVMKKWYYQLVCEITGISDYRACLIMIAVALALIYIFKNIFLLIEVRIQNRFVYNNMFATMKKLLHSYLMRPYEFFLGINSGEVIRIIDTDVQETFGLLTNLLSLLTEVVVSIILVVTIFIISPQVTIGMAMLLLIMLVAIMKFIKPLQRKAGFVNMEATAKMNQWLIQSIQGIKELKIMKKEQFFEKRFNEFGSSYVGTMYKTATLSILPRYLIEAASMSSFFIVVAMMIYSGAELGSLAPILSSVAIAALRLLPAANKISYSYGGFAYKEPRLDNLIETLGDIELWDNKNTDDETTAQFDISIKGLSKDIKMESISYKYPSGEKDVFSDASMEIKKGMSIGIVGSSGAGKTTAVDIILGLLKPYKGRVVVDNNDIEMDKTGWLSNIGYIPQSIFMMDGDIRENVAFGVNDDEIDDNRVMKAIEDAALGSFVKSLPDGIRTQLGERGMRLSGGQRQRIGIARALYTNPSVLVFDEATSALDNETENVVMEAVNGLKSSKTMIIIAHRLSTIKNCDLVYRVENGKIAVEEV